MDEIEFKRVFDIFNEHIQNLAVSIREENPDDFLVIVSNFSSFFGKIIKRLSLYEALIKRLGDYTDSEVAKELIRTVLEPDTSPEVDEFFNIINKNL